MRVFLDVEYSRSDALEVNRDLHVSDTSELHVYIQP